MVEDALRKMMAEGQGIFLDGEAGISFTLYQLQKELKNTGDSYSTQQIKQALTILARTSIELKSEDAEIEIYFSPFETLGFKGKTTKNKLSCASRRSLPKASSKEVSGSSTTNR